jgi:hypothetical protein
MSDRPTNLTGPGVASTRALLARLACGEIIVTERYAPRDGGFKTAHRRGFIVAERCRGGDPRLWRHALTPRGRAALDLLGGAASSPPSSL